MQLMTTLRAVSADRLNPTNKPASAQSGAFLYPHFTALHTRNV